MIWWVIFCLGKLSEQLCSLDVTIFGKKPSEQISQCPEGDETRLETIFSKDLPGARINYIFKIENMFLTSLYLLKKEEYKVMYGDVQEVELFHVTNREVFKVVRQDNLDWRKVVRHKFGHGISFSTDIDYANFFSNKNNKVQRVVLVCKVLVAKPCVGSPRLVVPPPQYDGSHSRDGYTYVKYSDNEFLPLYAIFFECTQDILKSSKFKRCWKCLSRIVLALTQYVL